MIKLILSDLDGTLLNDKKELPSNFYDVYEKLKKEGVKFGIATGRSYSSVKRDFYPIEKEAVFICEGGGVVVNEGKIIYEAALDKNLYKQVIAACKNIEDIVVIACGSQCAYTEKLNTQQEKEVAMYYASHKVVDDLLEINDDIVKIAIYDKLNAENNTYIKLQQYNNDADVVLSGADWVDVCVKGVSKASGLKSICNVLNIELDDIMAFGDYLNDYELLSALKHSYAMANAHDKVKSVSNYILDKTNNENGVISKICEKYNFVEK